MIMISSDVQSGYLTLFDLIGGVVQLFYEIFYHINMTMFNSSQETRVSFFVLDRMIYFQGLDHMFYHLYITSCNCKMQGDLPFRFFKIIQQSYKRCKILKD